MARLRQILTFLCLFALILAGSHFYMFERLRFYLQWSDRDRDLAKLILIGFPIATLFSLPLSRLLPRVFANILAWVVYPWMGVALLLFTTLLVTDIAWITTHFIPVEHLPEPRALLQHCFGVTALGITGFLGIFALWKGLAYIRVKPQTVTIERLPASLDGLRIVQLSDLHIGPLLNGRWLRRVVDRTNALKPDLIVITGDLVDGSVEELRQHVAPIADLRAKHGVYFITGNHEYYSGAEAWCAHVESLGIRTLRNQRVSIADGLDLAGTDDFASRNFPGGGADLPKALAGRDSSKPLILLAHQPAAADEAATHGVDLQLSGHTHGGQIWPFTYLVYLQQPYNNGLYRHKDTKLQVYVNPGTGFWGPPMRLGTTAEITHITLRSGTAS